MKKVEGEEKPKRKRGFSLARKVGKAYVDRKGHGRQESEGLTLLARDPVSGTGRLYLREGEGGKGTLIIDGSVVAHLNPMAMEYLTMVFRGMEPDGIVRSISRRYKVSSKIAKDDLKTMMEDITRLEMGGLPVRGSRTDPLSGPYYAPFRVDVALTYRTQASTDALDLEEVGELKTEDWLSALDKLWAFGIPHICITGGEPTVREDLVEVVDHARSLGFTIGLLTNGERLGSKAYLGRLIDAGLSYVQVELASHDEEVHAKVTGSPHHRKTVNGIRNAVAAKLPVLVNIIITKESEYSLEDTVEFLIGLGVREMTVHSKDIGEESIPEWAFEEALVRARRATRGRARIFWFGPTLGSDPRGEDEVEPVGELAMGKLDWGGGRVHIFVHPDGSVMPDRGHGTVLGNVLTHSWNMLWYHTVLKEIRSKKLEQRRWRSLHEIGFNGYPFFPGLGISRQKE